MITSPQDVTMTASDHQRPHGDLIDMYIAYLRLIRRSPRTIETYASNLWLAHRQLPYGLPSAWDGELLEWLGRPGYSVRTQRLRTTIIGRFFAWAVERDQLDYDPTLKLPRPTLPQQLAKPATDEQVGIILDRAPEPVRLWSLIAAYTGARAIEIRRLHREHIGKTVRLYGKGSKERLVPTHELVAAATADLPSGPITDRTEQHITNKSWRVYHQLGVEIGIHRLRAWFGNTMLQAGHDLATVQDLMGHSSPNTTRIYATPSAAQFMTAVAGLPRLDSTAAAADEGRG